MPVTDEFTDKVAFITGAGSGIGRATALAFAAAGAQVAAVDIDEQSVADTARQIQNAGGQALPLRCDVASEQELQVALTATLERFGGLDHAFNNAGVEQADASLAETAVADWDRILNTDVRGVFLAMKHQIPLILARGGGSIVNTSSGAGVIGIKGQAAYATAKHAVIGLTRSAALDYADTGLRINAVAPGMIDTAMMARVSGGTDEGYQQIIAQEPIGRMGAPEEIASAVLWLSSPRNAFVIGHTLVMDGGQTIR